jgi:hypothetical protein
VKGGARPGRLMKKLRGRTPDELRVRGLQLTSTWLERSGLSADVGVPDDRRLWKRLSVATRARVPIGDSASLLDEFRRASNSFVAGFDDREATIRELRRRWPNKAERIVAGADAICGGRFDLLGYKGLRYQPIDWHLEPLAAKRAPAVHWSRIDYLDPGLVGDHKLIWELNRHQYFITLGRAYWLTGDERYAAEIVRHLESWMDANPPKIGVNWASSLELAYRSLSWLWALHFLRDSASLTPATYVRVLAYLDRKARHVARHLSTYFSPNTHLTGEALGLLALGLCLPQLEQSARWRSTGWRILEQQLGRQVRRDGSYVEQSPHYQRYTIEIYLHAMALNRGAGRADAAGFAGPLQAALDHAMFLTMPDGLFPLVGDDDGGQLLPLDDGPLNDFRPALSTGAVTFRRGDYASLAGEAAEQTLWLLGPSALETFDSIVPAAPRETSRCFSDAGFCVMRDDWTRDSNYLLFDAGPHGYLSGGHAHADALSFVLVLAGRPVMVDPGTYLYSSTNGERDQFRSTAAHNTATIDGLSSSEPGPGPFQWSHSASTTLHRWATERRLDFVRASHDGFMRLSAPVRHERSVLYARGRYWVIRDRFLGQGRHHVGASFHCAPDIRASIADQNLVRLVAADAPRCAVDVAIFADNGTVALIEDWVAPEYGRKLAATTCRFDYSLNGAGEIVTFILPSHAGSMRVGRLDQRTYEVVADVFRDTHHLDDARPRAPDWLWIATRGSGEAEEVVVDGAAATVARGPRLSTQRDALSGVAPSHEAD